MAHGDAFGVSGKEPASLAAFEPPATIRRRLSFLGESERDVRRAPSATLCAYAFSATSEARTGVPLEGDAEDASVRSNRWLVATWTDEAGETFAVEARATDAFSLASASSDGLAELADWLVGRTRAFAAAKTAAAGHLVRRKETRKEKERQTSRVPRETLNDGEEDDARRLRRARAFFGAFDFDDDDDDAATLSSDSSVGAGVVVVEVVPGVAKARGDRAFAAALASALAREEGDARREETASGKKKKSDPSVIKIRRDDERVLVGETRVVVLADDDETFARVSHSSADVRATAPSAPFALIGADGAVATATRGGASRASNGFFFRDGFSSETFEAPLREKYRRRLAIATRVADARDFGAAGGGDDIEREKKKKQTTDEDDSSRVAFAFAALARASRVVRGVDVDAGRGSVLEIRDLVPPHVAACASLAATLRDLERVAAGHV